MTFTQFVARLLYEATVEYYVSNSEWGVDNDPHEKGRWVLLDISNT
jgi:hypothetical protein